MTKFSHAPSQTGMSDQSSIETAKQKTKECGCDMDIHIENHGDINIFNCPPPSEVQTPSSEDCSDRYPPRGACLPVVPGAKHKLSREFKLAELADRAQVPSTMAAGVIHMAKRFLLGKTPSGALETAAFATLSKIPRGILSCTVDAFNNLPPQQRNRLFTTLPLTLDQTLSESEFIDTLGKEILQRIGQQVFADPHAIEQQRPGQIRVYEPEGEDFFFQVRICSINDLRTASFIPLLSEGDLNLAEIQQNCAPIIVDGQPQVVCEVQKNNCPGNKFGSICMRVQDIAQGDGVTLKGVNYFSLDTKVRFSDKQTGNPVRDVETHVFGDIDTPVTEQVDGKTRLINDCRVHDRLTFQVPDDLPPATYQIQVVVPNITGISVLGTEIVSNIEYINVLPPASARFQIVTERIFAREETSPSWLGSDEVGLHTMAWPVFQDGTIPEEPIEQKFEDIQNIDFDSGTSRDITRKIFTNDKPIIGLILVVRGDEIDSQDAYDQEITKTTKFFIDLIKSQAAYILAAITAAGGLKVLSKLGTFGLVFAAIAAVILVGVDYIVALWAPADPIIRDAIGLSITDLAALTSANAPSPDPSTYTSEDNIVVNINQTVPPVKLPLEYHETREYVSDDQDSRYEITYRYNRTA